MIYKGEAKHLQLNVVIAGGINRQLVSEKMKCESRLGFFNCNKMLVKVLYTIYLYIAHLKISYTNMSYCNVR